jgi:hypothetical protein
VRLIGVRNADIFCLPPGISAREMGVPEQAGRRVAKHLVRNVPVPVCSLANREVPALALVAFAADDGERDNDAIADLQCVFAAGSHLHDLPHELVTHDIAVLHAGHVAVVEMQVGAADRATRHLDDGVARMFDLGIWNLIATDVLRAVPAQGLHCFSPIRLLVGGAGSGSR